MTDQGHAGIDRIMSLLPHRYPFLLVDRVIEHVPGQSVKAYKNVTIGEPFFQGHFPGQPIMPGVLILEALAQTGALQAFLDDPAEMADKLCLFAGMDKVRFRRQVVPGDRLDLHCWDKRKKMGILKMSARASVDGETACEAELMAAIVPKAG